MKLFILEVLFRLLNIKYGYSLEKRLKVFRVNNLENELGNFLNEFYY